MPDLSSPFDPWTAAAAAPDGPPALWAHRVQVKAQRRMLLSSVSLAVPPGAVVGLVGRNGAGKSTLLRALVGLVPLAEGECRLFGERSDDLTDAVRERLGFVAQTPDLFDHLNGRQHLERFGPLYPTFHWDRALDLAARLDLPMGTAAGRLSLGDQQKLSVVLALAHDPDLLILDEPVASLDPLTRRDFMRTLFERRWVSQEPRTVLISSHLLGDLERVVSHVAFLRGGRLQAFDAWDALAEHVRLVDLPAGSPWAPPDAAVLHRRTTDGRLRLLVDERRVGDEHRGIVAGGRSLNLDDLFVELNA